MNILITGGAGFIGSNIVDRYIKEGHQTIIADNLITGKVKNIKSTFKFEIRNKFKTASNLF